MDDVHFYKTDTCQRLSVLRGFAVFGSRYYKILLICGNYKVSSIFCMNEWIIETLDVVFKGIAATPNFSFNIPSKVGKKLDEMLSLLH